MTKVRLVDGTIVNATDVELVHGTLQISTEELTVEELAELFSDKNNVSLITLLTEHGTESGYKVGFTSFAGIKYSAEGVKTVELFQPKDVTEQRVANAEGNANAALGAAASASAAAETANTATQELTEANAMLTATVESILTEVIPSLVV